MQGYSLFSLDNSQRGRQENTQTYAVEWATDVSLFCGSCGEEWNHEDLRHHDGKDAHRPEKAVGGEPP